MNSKKIDSSSLPEREAVRKPFLKPQLERKEKLPKVTNTYVGTFNP